MANKMATSQVLCKHLKFRIKSNSYYSIWSKYNRLFEIFIYLFKCNIYKEGTVCLDKKLWLSAALLLTMVLTLDSSWSLYIRPLRVRPTKYWKNTTQTTNRVPQNCWNYSTMVIFENGKNYSIRFKVSTNDPKFHSKWKKHHLHSTQLHSLVKI